MNTNKKTPKLRFKGFTDDWEQRKLSDILVERNEQQVETNEYPLMSFVQGHGVVPKGERYDRSFLVLDQSKKYKRTELGDFIYSSNNLETGSIGINKMGKAVISPVYSIFYGVSIGDSQFIGIMSLLPRFIAKMIRFRQGVVYGQWRIHEKDFLDISILIPSEAERTKITKLILSIEELITLHQRKLEKLKLNKSALLQKLFPQKGCTIPDVRFKGFTDAWEQRKLSDILKVNSGKDYKHLEQGDIPVYGTGGYMLSVNESLSNIDAIGIGRKGTIDKPQYLKAPFWTVDTLFYLTALDKHSILFLYYLMQLMPWKKFDESTGVPSLSKTTIDNINGYVPSNPKEEELISTLFNQLDKSITLHQRKLDCLISIKKGLLQQLFV